MSNQIKWSIDHAHSEISFKVRHLMIAHVKGTFKKFDATIYTTDKDFKTAEIDLWIEVSSISTGDEKRDEHLKKADFFDEEKFKKITFTAKGMGAADPNGDQELSGDLTMKGVTKNVKLTVKFGGIVNDPWGKERAGFTLTGKINRNDWGLSWNSPIENGGLVVGEEIIISSEIELTNAGQKSS